jgi:hypothetical protein
VAHAAWHQRAIGKRRQFCQLHAIREFVQQIGRDLHGQRKSSNPEGSLRSESTYRGSHPIPAGAALSHHLAQHEPIPGRAKKPGRGLAGCCLL